VTTAPDRSGVTLRTGAAELREAATHARLFASSLEAPDLKESFLLLAAKWEAEAQAMEAAG
jgi:hypothetical protein